MRIFFDTEFNGFREGSALLSIGLVAEDERECYAELPPVGPHLRDADDFVIQHVVGQFGRVAGAAMATRTHMAIRVATFLESCAGELEVCFDYKLDWRHLEDLLRREQGILRRLQPCNVAGVMAKGDGAVAAHESFLRSARDGLLIHHALADARALRAACMAGTTRSFVET